MTPLPWADLNRDYPVELTKITAVRSPDVFPLSGPDGPRYAISTPDSPAGIAAGRRLAGRIGAVARTAGLPDPAVAPRPAGWPAGRQRIPRAGFPAGSAPVRIIIGDVDSNRDLAELYHSLSLPVDPVFPGPGGAYVRTFAGAWGDDADAVIVGVSSEDDLDAALDLLDPSLVVDDGQVAIARTHRVVIGAEFRDRHPELVPDPDPEAFRAAAVQAYRTRAHRGMTPYLNHLALMHQLTGEIEFARRYRDLFAAMVTETAGWQPDQWGRWGFDADFAAVGMIAGWHAIKDSPAFDDEDRRNLVAHLLAYLGNSEEQWLMHRETASYPARHNHFTFASLGLLFGANLIARAHDPERAERWLRMADECFAPQLTATKSTEDCDAYGWLALAHTLRYALVRPWPAYFDDGWCARTLHRGITAMDNLGHQVPHGDASSYDGNYAELPYWTTAAWVLQDPTARSLVARKIASKPDQASTLGIAVIGHDYGAAGWTRHDAVVSLPALDVQPLDDAFVATQGVPAPAAGFDKLALRDGAGPTDRYLLLDGVGIGGHGHADAGAIVRLTARDRIWLEDADYDKISANFHNTVLILRDGVTTPRPPYAALRWTHHDQQVAAGTVELPGLAGCIWTRSVLLLSGLGFVVVDTVTAERAGPVEVHTLWRTVGRAEPAEDRWTVTMGEERLQVLSAPAPGERWTEQVDEPYQRTNWPSYPYAEPAVSVLRQVVAADLAAGESRTGVHLLVDGPDEAEIERRGDLVDLVVGDRRRRLDLAALAAGDGARLITDPSSEAGPPVVRRPSRPAATARSEPTPVWTFEQPATATLITDLGDGDRLLVGDDRGVTCVADGRPAWRSPTVAPVTALGRGGGPDGDGIVVGQADGRLTVLDVAGRPLWQQTFSPHMGHPATVRAAFPARLDRDGPPSVIIATESCHVEAFTADGGFRWRYEVIHSASAATAADLDGDGLDEVLTGTEYWSWHAIRPDGSALFRTRGVDGSGCSAVATVPEGGGRLAVFAGWDGHLTAYRASGERAWDLALADLIITVITVEDDLVVGTRAGRLHRIGADGRIRWHRPLGAAVTAGAIVGDAIMVALSDRIVPLDGDGTAGAPLPCPAGPVGLGAFRTAAGSGLLVRDARDRFALLPRPDGS